MRKKKLLHLFIPHSETHQKAHLLSWHFLLIYLLLFLLLRTGLDLAKIYQPGILGVESNITVERVIEATNEERQKAGLPPLKHNPLLSEAARQKAANMFAENYWAHFSPSGKDPWGFIKGAGYAFLYAGENLAKNFQTSDDVVKAWMNSSSHKDNLLNSRYQEIGIGVMDGVLQGQKTTLVVQMFGTPSRSVAVAPKIESQVIPTPKQQAIVPTVTEEKKIAVNAEEVKESQPIFQSQPISIAGAQTPVLKPILDPYQVTRMVGISLISFIAFLLVIDFIALKRRGVFRFSSHHLAHLSLLGVSGASLFLTKIGEIL